MRIGRVIVPTGVSLAVHAALVGLAALATWTVVRTPGREMPTVELSLDAPGTVETREPPVREPVAQGERSVPRVGEVVESLAFPEIPGPGERIAAPIIAPARGDGEASAAAAIQGVRGGAGPASFAGVTARRASSVVFVVDCSGSMVSALSIVLEELGRSIERLAPDQRFAIVPFRDGVGEDEPRTFPATLELVPATDANLRAARSYLRTLTPGGRSDPLAGLEPALALRPEAVFFLARSIERTEGTWGGGKEAILRALDGLNPVEARRSGERARRTQVSAVQFLEDDPTGIMQAIGEAHGRGRSGYTVRTPEQIARAGVGEGPSARQIAAEMERAAGLLGALSEDGTDLAVLAGFPSDEQVARVKRHAEEALRLVERAGAALGMSEGEEGLREEPRVVLLRARAALLLGASALWEGDGKSGRRNEDAVLESGATRSGAAERMLALARDAGKLLDGGEVEGAGARELAMSTWAFGESLRAAGPSAEARERWGSWMEAWEEGRSLELALASIFMGEMVPSEAGAFQREQGPDAGALLLRADAITRVGMGWDEANTSGAPYATWVELDVESPSVAEREAILRERIVRLVSSGEAARGEPLARLAAMLWGEKGTLAARLDEVRGLVSATPALGVKMTLERAAELAQAEDVETLRISAGLAGVVAEGAGRRGLEEVASQGDEVRLVALARAMERGGEPELRALMEAVLEAVSEEETRRARGWREASLAACAAVVREGREATWADVETYGLLRVLAGEGVAREHVLGIAGALDSRLARLAARDGERDRHLVGMMRSMEVSEAAGAMARVEVVRDVAMAMVEMGGDEGVDAARRLVEHPDVERVEGGRTGARVLLARAQLNAGDGAGALETLAGLAREMQEPREGEERVFWEVWTLTLETMARVEPSRREEAARHVTRLSLIDEGLGGEPWAARLRMLQR